MPAPYGGPWKSGTKPRVAPSAGCTQVRSHGARTKTPHRPNKTLGTAATSSTRNAIGARIGAGARSARKIGAPRPRGPAANSQVDDLGIVPEANATPTKLRAAG